ncbi:mycofactocin-coupled SDR family oxidoreductase [Microbacterium sp. X-17]|uniref:mycofactocin-coupled SDR family oxidoreductase n=1 Tax=Microbacterium sp. X-17 TaxID=3144404 RepID=UPI0031F58E43
MSMLEGKVAFITGGARGQGRAHAITCAREGAAVAIFDVPDPLDSVPYGIGTAAELEETVRLVEEEGGRILAFRGDVRSQADLDSAVAATVDAFGRIDILIANAGIWYTENFWELSESQWQETIDTNLGGVWRSAKAVAPTMMAQQSGSMVLVASINGHESGPTYAHYAASKHGVVGLMKSLAVELAPHGVRCNALCPGPTRTPMTDHQAAWDLFAGHPGGTEADMLDAGYNFLALKGVNWLRPQAQADAALFLNSDLAASVTGISLPVDAGHLVLPGNNPAPVRGS